MSLALGLMILMLIFVLLGKAIFDPDSPSVEAASQPLLRNFTWQLALLISATLMMVSQFQDIEAAANQVWLMVSVGIAAFALLSLARTLIRHSLS